MFSPPAPFQGLFSTDLQVPDVYGVFQFKVEYKRVGYTTLDLTKQVRLRWGGRNEREGSERGREGEGDAISLC